MTCSWCQATREGPQCAVLSGLLASFNFNAFIALTLLYGVVFNPFSLMCCCHHLAAATMLYSIATLLLYSPASLLLYSRFSLLIYSPASLLIYSSPCYSTSRLLATPFYASLLLHFTPPCYSTLRLLATLLSWSTYFLNLNVLGVKQPMRVHMVVCSTLWVACIPPECTFFSALHI